MNLAKVLAVVLAFVVVLNLAGLTFGIIKPVVFFGVAAIAAITAYKVIPKLNAKEKKN